MASGAKSHASRPERMGTCKDNLTDEIRPYHNFAPFVRQTGERKAQACAKEMLRQLSEFSENWEEEQPAY
jgi:hypothetical protein